MSMREPAASVKRRSALAMISPPLLGVVESPRAESEEDAANWMESEARSSMTPLCSRTEFAWIDPDWFTTRAWRAIVPASAVIWPEFWMLPEGNVTEVERPRPSGRWLRRTSLPEARPIEPAGAARVPWLPMFSAIRKRDPPGLVWMWP
jgi:hypothetical protein